MTVTTVKAIISGVEYTLTPISGQSDYYSVEITAPSKTSGSNNNGVGVDVGTEAQGLGYYPITLNAEDDAGNITEVTSTDPELGESLRLKVLETIKPTVTITSPASGAVINNSQPTISAEVADTGSGIKSCSVIIDSGTALTMSLSGTASTSPRTASYTPESALTEGSHTITITALDYDGNASTAVTSTFKIDTAPPTANITNPIEGRIYNSQSVTLSGTTNDATSSPVSVAYIINSGESINVAVAADGSFSQALTGVKEGANTLTVTFTDSAGLQTVIVRSFNVDSTAPVFSDLTLSASTIEVNGKVIITVKVTDV